MSLLMLPNQGQAGGCFSRPPEESDARRYRQRVLPAEEKIHKGSGHLVQKMSEDNAPGQMFEDVVKLIWNHGFDKKKKLNITVKINA